MNLDDNSIARILSLYTNKVDIDTFNFDLLTGPHVYQLIPPMVVEAIHQFIINPKNSGDTQKKIKYIDETLYPYGFKRLAGGTNRVVYKYLEDTSFVLKVAFDKTGLTNNPDEFKNQALLKPFVNKIFSVSQCGTIATCERVIPIRSRQEFTTIAGDVFDVIANKFIGKYILEDIGDIWFKNWGIRSGFGPVLLDYPYLYKADLNGLYCNEMTSLGLPCGGQIDYDDGFNILYCTRCGKRHKAKQVGKAIENKSIAYKGGSTMADFKVVLKRGDEVIVDRKGADTYIDPNQVKQPSSVVTTRTVRPGGYSNDDFDLVVVIRGVKMGRKGDEWYNLGPSKSKVVQRTKPATENPYKGVVSTKSRKPKPIESHEAPEWVNDPNITLGYAANSKESPKVLKVDMSMYGSNEDFEDITVYGDIWVKHPDFIKSEQPSSELVVEELDNKSNNHDEELLKEIYELAEEDENIQSDNESIDKPEEEQPKPSNDLVSNETNSSSLEKYNSDISDVANRMTLLDIDKLKSLVDEMVASAMSGKEFTIISTLATAAGAIKSMNNTDTTTRANIICNALYNIINKIHSDIDDTPDENEVIEEVTESVSDESEDNIMETTGEPVSDESTENSENESSDNPFNDGEWASMLDNSTVLDQAIEVSPEEAEEYRMAKHIEARNAIAEHFGFSPEDYDRSEDDMPDVSEY